MVHKETTELFSSEWMAKLHIAPFPLDPDLIDLSNQFKDNLYNSLLTQGWQKDQTMIIATSADSRLNGQPIQGRQRIIEISRILKDGHKFPTRDILIRYEEVNSVDELRAKRAAYEVSAALSKDPKISKAWVKANLNPIIKNNYSPDQTKLLEYLHNCGFSNDQIAKELIEDYQEVLENKAKRKKLRQGGGQTKIPANMQDRTKWGLDPSQPTPTTYDDATTYLREVHFKCTKCGEDNKVPINVAVGDERKLVKCDVATLKIKR